MTDQRCAQIVLYNAFGYFNNQDWGPGNHDENDAATAWAGDMTEDDLLAIAHGDVVSEPKPETESKHVVSNNVLEEPEPDTEPESGY